MSLDWGWWIEVDEEEVGRDPGDAAMGVAVRRGVDTGLPSHWWIPTPCKAAAGSPSSQSAGFRARQRLPSVPLHWRPIKRTAARSIAVGLFFHPLRTYEATLACQPTTNILASTQPSLSHLTHIARTQFVARTSFCPRRTILFRLIYILPLQCLDNLSAR